MKTLDFLFGFFLLILIVLSGCTEENTPMISKTFRTINADSGSATAGKMKDTLTVIGGDSISTAIVDKNLSIDLDLGKARLYWNDTNNELVLDEA